MCRNCAQGEELNERRSSVLYATFTAAYREPEKIQACMGFWTLDLCDTSATLYQLS